MTDSKSAAAGEVESEETQFGDTESLGDQLRAAEANVSAPEKPEASIGRMLAGYEIGSKLRRLRLRKKIALAELGKHTGLSASMLSQLENGKLIPTLPTLSRIAMVFDVGLEHFFDGNGSRRVFVMSRAHERLRFPERADTLKPAFFFEVLVSAAVDKRIYAYIAEFPLRTAEEVAEHEHEGWELIHVLSGVLAIRYGSEDHILESGDSVYFDASEPHSYRGQSEPAAQALVITT